MLEKYFPNFKPKSIEERWDKGIWWNSNLVNRVHTLMQQGWAINDEGLFEQKNLMGYFDGPWIFVPHPNVNVDMHCYLWKDVLFSVLMDHSFIPAYCRTYCHKVVVTMPTVKALFQWYPVMRMLCRVGHLHGKLGVDRRDYTGARYAAFFYCQSMEEGQEVKGLVEQALLKERIADAGWKVLLKKGCTEMDAVCPSSKWGIPNDDDLHFEDQFYDMFELRAPHPQPQHLQRPWLKNRIMFEWLSHARRIGDETWKEVIPDNQEYRDTLFGKNVQVVTY